MEQVNPAGDSGQARGAPVQAQPEWLNYPNAERYCGLSRVTLWRAAKDGELKIARIGKAVRIRRRELDRFMESRVEEEGR